MFVGRVFGWFFLISAFFTASAEAVAAFGSGEYVGIATADVLTIITGMTAEAPLLRCPAWTTMAVVGAILIFCCRKKKYKISFGPK